VPFFVTERKGGKKGGDGSTAGFDAPAQPHRKEGDTKRHPITLETRSRGKGRKGNRSLFRASALVADFTVKKKGREEEKDSGIIPALHRRGGEEG